MDLGTLSPNLSYVLRDGPPEIRRYVILSAFSVATADLNSRCRLSIQYLFMKGLVNNQSLVPHPIDISKVHRVLDAAAGTAVWALDFVDERARCTVGAEKLDIYACDITLSKFPPAEIMDTAGIKTFVQDLTKPFPEEMHGTFDLVHMTYLVYALPEPAWKLVLKNIHDVLSES